MEKVATLAGYPLTDLVDAGYQLLAQNCGKEPGAQRLIRNDVIEDDPAKGPQGSQRNLDGLALAAELFVELVLGLGVRPGQQLVEHVDHLIDGVAIALPEKADQCRAAMWLGEFTQSSDDDFRTWWNSARW